MTINYNLVWHINFLKTKNKFKKLKKMKKITLLLLGIVLTISISAQDLNEILQAHYEVMGYDQMTEINTLVFTGKSNSMGMENPYTMTMKRPDQYKLVVPIQGQKMIQVYNKGEAWYVAPWTGSLDPQDMTGDQLKQMKKQADFEGPLYNYADKGNKVELVGTEDMEGSEVYKIKLIDEFEDETTYFLDAENLVVLKEESKTNMRGEDVKSETYYSDFKPVGDTEMIMPYAFEVRINGQVMSRIEVETVELNPEVDVTIFDRPAPSAPAKEVPTDK